jgi:hypothetical protein
LQTWLELAGTREVTIPFAHELAAKASPKAVRLRRDFGAVLELIATHAMLHQAQRARDEQGRIVTTLEDYRQVYRLVLDIVSEGIQATVSRAVRETVEAVRELYQKHERPVTVLQVAQHLKLDKSAALRRVRVAEDLGFIVNEESRRGKPAQLVPGEPLPEEEPILPAPEELSEAEPPSGCTVAVISEGVSPPPPYQWRLHGCFERGVNRPPWRKERGRGEGGGGIPSKCSATMQPPRW